MHREEVASGVVCLRKLGRENAIRLVTGVETWEGLGGQSTSEDALVRLPSVGEEVQVISLALRIGDGRQECVSRGSVSRAIELTYQELQRLDG